MPDKDAVQKIDVILSHPLTESCRTWLIKPSAWGYGAIGAAAVFRKYALRREFDRMKSATPLRALSRVLALAALVLLPIAPGVTAQTVAPPAGTASIDKAATPDVVKPARRESPAGYMKRVGNELLTASRSGSVSQMAMVLNSNADIPSIGLSALGDYARVLPKNDRQIYYNGMINFIARYAAKEAPKYPVAKFVVYAQSKEDPRGTYVDSRITLASGDAYDVRWLVVRRGDTFKVRDAQVIGFWMTSFLDNLFQSFISDNGGNPRALVVALNR